MCCWFIRLARTGTLATAFWCRAALAQSRKSDAFSFSGSGVSIKELAEWFGLEIARIVVDKCGSATELNGQVSQTLLPQVSRLFGNRCPERKGKMRVQAINVRCLKCGYRLAWVLVEENGSGTKRRRF